MTTNYKTSCTHHNLCYMWLISKLVNYINDVYQLTWVNIIFARNSTF